MNSYSCEYSFCNRISIRIRKRLSGLKNIPFLSFCSLPHHSFWFHPKPIFIQSPLQLFLQPLKFHYTFIMPNNSINFKVKWFHYTHRCTSNVSIHTYNMRRRYPFTAVMSASATSSSHLKSFVCSPKKIVGNDRKKANILQNFQHHTSFFTHCAHVPQELWAQMMYKKKKLKKKKQKLKSHIFSASTNWCSNYIPVGWWE